MKKILTLALLLSSCFVARAQHTFSMIAVDTVTMEIGSAGATCLSEITMGDLLNRIVPGKGAINTQAWVSPENREYGAVLLQKGYNAQQVLDSIYARDEYPEDRQNLVLNVVGSHPQTAGFTGAYCMTYANHRVGPNYVIAGNILSGPHVLDSMENAFNRTKGGLADKLMAALMAAKFPGADSRCKTTSSLSSFIRLAKPWDALHRYTLDISVSAGPDTIFEPIDTLYAKYTEAKASGFRPAPMPQKSFILHPNPAADYIFLELNGFGTGEQVTVELLDLSGRLLQTVASGTRKNISVPVTGLKPGLYIINVNGVRKKLIKS
jgi:uncharacterized Ntn-hydrolase superfamily protein